MNCTPLKVSPSNLAINLECRVNAQFLISGTGLTISQGLKLFADTAQSPSCETHMTGSKLAK